MDTHCIFCAVVCCTDHPTNQLTLEASLTLTVGEQELSVQLGEDEGDILIEIPFAEPFVVASGETREVSLQPARMVASS